MIHVLVNVCVNAWCKTVAEILIFFLVELFRAGVVVNSFALICMWVLLFSIKMFFLLILVPFEFNSYIFDKNILCRFHALSQ